MTNGKLVAPNLDDRTWQDIVNQARALIPNYTQDWTDHNPSDLGITLLELFAWLVEGLIYRLNRVPDKHYIELLNLLGITRDPATPASTPAVFTVSNAPSTLVPRGTRIATRQTQIEEPVVFETDEALVALPVNLRTVLIAGPGFKTAIYQDHSAALALGPTATTAFNLPGGHADTLLLGFDLATTEPLRIRLDIQRPAPEGDVQLEWTYSRTGLDPTAWPTVVPDVEGTQSFTRSGTTVVSVPANWQPQTPAADWTEPVAISGPGVSETRFWLGLRIGNLTAGAIPLALQFVGFNAVQVTNALSVNVSQGPAEVEFLGVSSGKAFQTLTLANVPLYRQPGTNEPYAHFVLEVREPLGGGAFGPWTAWTAVDDFPAGDGAVFRFNPVTGDVFFGNHDSVTGTGNGRIPPTGSEIRALTYRYTVGGVRGNVPAHSLIVLRDPQPGVIAVTNPAAATGGSDQETIEDTKRRAPEVLKNRQRAVALTDYEYLAREASTDVVKVRALAPRLHEQGVPLPYIPGEPWLFAGIDRSPGRVNAIVVPDAPEPQGDPDPVPRPLPDEVLLIEVADYLNPKRPATAHLHVTGPRYLPIRVVTTIRVWQAAVDDGLVADPTASNAYRNSVIDQLQRFLHPTRGNANGKGWDVGEYIYVNQVFAAIQPSNDIGFIESIELRAATPDYGPHPTDRPPGFDAYDQGTWILVADYELICYGGLAADVTVQTI
jgi:uncharacterized phage protein gp47/JayE